MPVPRVQPLRVHARVHDEPAGAHRVHRQHAEAVDVAGVQAHLVGQALGVQAPALRVRGRVDHAAQQWQLGQLLRDGDLEVVARHGLVEGHHLGHEPVPFGRAVGVREVDARPLPVHRRPHVVRRRGAGGVGRRHRLDLALVRGQLAEPARHRVLGTPDRLLCRGEQLVGVLPAHGRVAGHAGEDLGPVRGAEHPRTEHRVLLGQRRDDVQAGLVQLVAACGPWSCARGPAGGTAPRRPAASTRRPGRPAGPAGPSRPTSTCR